MPVLRRNRCSLIVQCLCLCAVRFFLIALAVLFFFYLRNLQMQIVQKLDGNMQDSKQIFTRIERMESQLKTFENINKITKLFMQPETTTNHQNVVSDCKTEVLSALKQYYFEDKTGQPDYALASAGGRILRVQDTENINEPKLFWWPMDCEGSHGPSQILNPGMMPGQCWAFKGSRGTAIILLIARVKITSVSLEHIPQTISHAGDIKSAPRDFAIWGLTSAECDGEYLGSFIYDKEGPALQVFNTTSLKAYDTINFTVSSNHGNPHFTCVYRLRVHGV